MLTYNHTGSWRRFRKEAVRVGMLALFQQVILVEILSYPDPITCEPERVLVNQVITKQYRTIAK